GEGGAEVGAAHGQEVGSRPVDGQVVGDSELAAGQGDGPAQSRGELDTIVLGLGVGVEDRLPQRAGAVVGEVLDQERAGDGAVLQRLQPGDVARPRPPRRGVAATRAAAPDAESLAWEQGREPHGSTLLQRGGLRYNGEVTARGAQTERPGEAGPVRDLLARKSPPAVSCPDVLPAGIRAQALAPRSLPRARPKTSPSAPAAMSGHRPSL